METTNRLRFMMIYICIYINHESIIQHQTTILRSNLLCNNVHVAGHRLQTTKGFKVNKGCLVFSSRKCSLINANVVYS